MGASPGPALWRGCKKNFSAAFRLFLVGRKFVPWGANSCFLEFSCKDMGPGDIHRGGPEREESRCGLGQRSDWACAGPAEPSHAVTGAG